MSEFATVASKCGVATRTSSANLRKINLIGYTTHQMTGSKLPSNRQVLEVMFYNMRFVDLSAKESAKLSIKAAQIFWQQARVPLRKEDKCVEKLLKLYENWKNIQKTIPEKRSDTLKKVVDIFVESLDDLFDIAAADALEKMKITEDIKFLKMQRQKGRPGCMAGVDQVLYNREIRAQERREKAESRKRKYMEENNKCSNTIEESDEDDTAALEVDNENISMPCFQPTACKKRRGRTSFITPRLLAALDNAKLSDGMAVHILIAAAEALDYCVQELAINRSTIHRMRQQNRCAQFNEISVEFKDKVSYEFSIIQFQSQF